MHGDGVEAVVDRDVTGERVVDALLRSMAMTEPQPVMAMAHSMVCTPILAPPSTATTPSPCACRLPLDQVQGELDVDGVGGGGFQQLLTDAARRRGNSVRSCDSRTGW